MRKIIDRFILGRALWPALFLAWGMYAFAEPRMVTLDVDGQTISVWLDQLPETAVVKQGDTARTVLLFTASDAWKIQTALDNAGLGYALPEVLAALRPGDRDPFCVLLTLPDGSDERITITGTPGRTSEGRIIWTPQQLTELVAAIHARGWIELAPELIGLREGVMAEAAPQPSEPQPLDPKCGTCLNGGTCRVDGKERCCSSGIGCMACKVCITVQREGG